MNLQEQIIADQGKKFADQMDQEIKWIFLEELGWSRVEISREQDNQHAIDITHWLADHCQGTYERNGRRFIFEDPKDAVLFSLKWVA
jgi:hypothetical protein